MSKTLAAKMPTILSRMTNALNVPSKTLIHLPQIKEETRRKRAKNLLRSALSQLEAEVEKGDLLGARVRELEEMVERVQRNDGRVLGVDVSRNGGLGGAEVEGLNYRFFFEIEHHRDGVVSNKFLSFFFS